MCGGDGCGRCGGEGTFTLTTCAHGYVTPDVWRMLSWVDRYKTHGGLPEDGGFLSQSASFLASLDFMSADMRHWGNQQRK